MNELEQTKHIIQSKYYTELFDAITDYLRDNPAEFMYDGDYYDQYWLELGLHDYKLLAFYYEWNHGIRIMNIIVEAQISVCDLDDLGLNRIIYENLHIEASIGSDYENFKVMYVERYLCGL